MTTAASGKPTIVSANAASATGSGGSAGAGGAGGVSPRVDVRADRLKALPPFLFDEIDRKKRERIAAGADVINLGVGDPDQPTPEFVVEEMNRAMRVVTNQQYPTTGGGMKVFREAAAEFMQRRFGVTIDPMKHVVALLGSKDGISHLPWAITNPGDVILAPDPAYPVYEVGAVLAGCSVVKMPVSRETGWKPVFDHSVDAQLAGKRARILWLNYPSNPTSASADVGFYERAVAWCGERGIVPAADLAYSELYFEHKPVSMWQAKNADISTTAGIEFHSLSKTFNMAGWRLGFAVGHPSVIAALQEVKSNVDSGTFNAIQAAGAVAMRRFDDPAIETLRGMYRQRRDIAVAGLRAAGCEVDVPSAGFFIWAKCPGGMDSMTYGTKLLEKADVVVVPGIGFSPRGNEYIRVSLTSETHRVAEAMRRIGGMGK